MSRTLVLVRHGQSEWNLKNLFTGWRDVDLTEQGHAEAKAAGQKLKERGLKFDIAFTSALTRAQKTCQHILDAVGQGARVMIKRAFALRETELPEAEIDPLYERFITHYRAEMPGESRPYPGIVKTLDALSQSGITLAVCTNKTAVLAVPLLEKLGLTPYFAAITCGDTFEFRKPDARHILGTIERAGGDIRRTVMVGDSINDILAAKNANVPSIGVTFGYTDVPMAELKPDVVIDNFDALTPTLFEKLIARGAAAA